MSEDHSGTVLRVARARLGDAAAFQTLIQQYMPRMLWFLRKLGLSDSDADDVLQESWLTVWTILGRLRDLRKFRPWLYRIVRNKEMQHIDRESSDDVSAGEMDLADEPAEQTLWAKYQPYLNQAIEQLPVLCREIIALRFIEEMTYEELAETLNVPVGTVKSRLHKARGELRSILEELAHE